MPRSPPFIHSEAGSDVDVDVVVAWVDGNDPDHAAKRNRFRGALDGDAAPERVATKARRFSDNDEIRYCLRSIRNYAPWVRTIWLLTDDQVPASIDRSAAERENIRFVSHKEIFRGLELLLPTFNSLAIETMLWRIEGLADRFLYLNDDMMFVQPVAKQDFFTEDGKVLLRGTWSNWAKRADADVSFHGSNKLLAANMLGFERERFFSPIHVVYPMLRPAMQWLFDHFAPQFAANAAYRFRDRSQFWPISLQNHLLIRDDGAIVRKPSDALHFSVTNCRVESSEQLQARLSKLREGKVAMTCINYLEAVIEKVPDAREQISAATGPAAPFEISAARQAA